MSGHHKFTGLTEGFSPHRQADISRRSARLKEEAQAKLQQAVQLTQIELAEKSQLGQLVVIEAMGDQLEIVAHFGDGEVKITNFSQFKNS